MVGFGQALWRQERLGSELWTPPLAPKPSVGEIKMSLLRGLGHTDPQTFESVGFGAVDVTESFWGCVLLDVNVKVVLVPMN